MNALEINKLEKIYKNNMYALKGIDLQVEEGDFFALLGPNGAGKSTTIGILSSLVIKTGGKVHVFGHDIDTESNIAKSYLGIVPQEFNFSMFETCMEIVLNQAGYYGIRRHIAQERAEKLFRQLGLWEKRFERSRTLSGGYKRRLLIARALIHDPEILILDEPTAGVDVELRRSMWKFLTRINREGKTIVLTTHYLEEAETLCKNIAIINDGLIVENTSVKDFLTKLNVETFILDLDGRCSSALDSDEFTIRQIDPFTLEVDLVKGQKINALFRLLSDCDVQVRSMRNKSNRLEELFIRLTNKDNTQEE
ncbi:MAG: ABC transporter ATP-binding protein [Gammaproteobacteria bacterium]